MESFSAARQSAVRYEIESVRIPKARLALYSRGEFAGTDDIALVRTRKKVVFVPGRIMPVREGCLHHIFSKSWHCPDWLDPPLADLTTKVRKCYS